MGIDTSIYSGYIRPNKTAMEQMGDYDQLKSNKLARMMQQSQYDEQQRGIAQGKTEADVYRGAVGPDGKIDRNKLVTGLAQGGAGAKISGVQKGFADQDKAELESQMAKTKAALEKFAAVRQFIMPATNQAEYDIGVQNLIATLGPEAAQGVPPMFDAARIQNGAKQALPIEKQLEEQHKELTRKLEAEKFTYQKTHDADKLAEDRRAHNMLDSRAREGNRLKAQENGIARDGIVGKRTQDVELKLQDDYRAESKGWSETSTAMKKVSGAIATADKNPGSALAAGTAFMKLLDPNSVVRESELGMALNASGWFDRATNIAATLQSGKIMTEAQKKNLSAASENLFEEAKAAQREVDAAYRKRATDYGANPDRVIVDRGQNKQRAESPAPGSAGMVKVTDAASFAKVPSGAKFIHPDGSIRRKP